LRAPAKSKTAIEARQPPAKKPSKAARLLRQFVHRNIGNSSNRMDALIEPDKVRKELEALPGGRYEEGQ
jgi:hypothetical protein